MWSTVHTHSEYCDGKGKLSDYVTAARKAGAVALGFSSHAPLPFDCAWCMKRERFPSYLEEIERLKSGTPVPLYKGLEVDFIPGIVSPLDFEDQLDYTIGSIHFVDAFPNGRHWEIDGMHTSFLEGLKTIFGNNIRAVIGRYFEITREMIARACPTIIGHLDKIKIQNIDSKFFNESDRWYRDEVTRTLQLIRESGAIVEVNTRGLYQKKSSTPYPSPWILERILEYDIPIALNSDAHHPDDLFNRFPEVAELLLKTGFKTLSILIDGKWQQAGFTEKGIALEHDRI